MLGFCLFLFISANGFAQRYYTHFYPAPQTNQYFIKPLVFAGGDQILDFDVTIRDSAGTLLPGDLRYFTISTADARVVDSLLVLVDGQRYVCTIGKSLYAERKGNKKSYRHEAKISPTALKALLTGRQRAMRIVLAGKGTTLAPNKRAKKALKNLAQNLPFMF